MADYNLSVQIEAIDKASWILQGVSNSLKWLSKETWSLSDKFLKRSWNINKFASEYGASLRNMSDASKEILGKIRGWFDEGAQSISDYAYMQERLAILTKNSTGASKEETQALIKQAEAIESVWVASKEAIVAAQSQLATFDMSVDAIKELTPALVDYVVAEKGATASMDEYKSMANGLAQALNGNFATLTRAWFVLDEETKAMISNWSEMERVTAIAKVLDSTYKDFNKTIAETATWKGIMLDRQLWNIKEQIAKNLIPVVDSLKEKLLGFLTFINNFAEEHPKLTKGIVLTTTAVLWLWAWIWTILQLAPILWSALKLVWNAVTVLSWVFGKLGWVLSTVAKFLVANPRVAIATAAVTAAVLIYENWDKVKEFVLWVFDAISEKVQAVKDWIIEKFEALPEPIKKVLEWIYNFYKTYFWFIIDTVRNVVSFIWDAFWKIGEIFQWIWDKLSPSVWYLSDKRTEFCLTAELVFHDVMESITEAVESAKEFIEPIIQAISDFIWEHTEEINAVIETIKATVWAVFGWMWEDVKFVFNEIWIIIKTVAGVIVDTLSYAFKQIWNIFTLFSNIFKGDRQGVLDTLKKMFDDFVQWFWNIFWDIWTWIKESIGAITDRIWWKIDVVIWRIDKVKNARKSVTSLFSSEDTWKALENKAAEWMKKYNDMLRSKAESIAGAKATGWPVSAWSTYLVWEKWPELFVPKTSGEIVPNNQITNNNDININMSWITVRSESDIQSLADEIARRIKLEKNFWII